LIEKLLATTFATILVHSRIPQFRGQNYGSSEPYWLGTGFERLLNGAFWRRSQFGFQALMRLTKIDPDYLSRDLNWFGVEKHCGSRKRTTLIG
jgi:hypothetical protein